MNPAVLEKYRNKKGLNITELARMLDRTPGWYSRIKNGQKELPTKYIAPLASIFGIRPDRLAKELFAGEELEFNSIESN